jgi:hypothetical protein
MNHWKTTELTIMRQHYPTEGVRACVALLPHRTRGAITQRARLMGLAAPKQRRKSPAYKADEWTDAQIRKTYESGLRRGDRRRLEQRLNRPGWWITKRAVAMGLAIPARRDPAWTEAETKLLEDTLTLDPHKAAIRFRRAGFARSATAIAVMRQRMGMRQQRDTYTANELAGLMGVELKKIVRWIADNRLQAKRRGTARDEKDPWEIKPAAVRALIIGYTAEIDIRRCNKFWLVDLLTGSTGAKAAGLKEAV